MFAPSVDGLRAPRADACGLPRGVPPLESSHAVLLSAKASTGRSLPLTRAWLTRAVRMSPSGVESPSACIIRRKRPRSASESDTLSVVRRRAPRRPRAAGLDPLRFRVAPPVVAAEEDVSLELAGETSACGATAGARAVSAAAPSSTVSATEGVIPGHRLGPGWPARSGAGRVPLRAGHSWALRGSARSDHRPGGRPRAWRCHA